MSDYKFITDTSTPAMNAVTDKINLHPEDWLPGEDLPSFLKDIKNPIGIEIGTDQGTTTEYLLRTIPDLTLYGVDDYTENRTENVQNLTFQIYMNKVSPYSNRFFHYRKTSNDAVDEFKDESVDFVFVDGDHRYAQVLKDCHNYYPKVKNGGLFCGHDWSLPDVNRAIVEFALSIGKFDSIKTMKQDVWYWIK
jgi:hypothetical protein